MRKITLVMSNQLTQDVRKHWMLRHLCSLMRVSIHGSNSARSNILRKVTTLWAVV